MRRLRRAAHAGKHAEILRRGGRPPVAGRDGLYQIERVLEKPTPTQAEQELIVPGLRAGHYLCLFGMHVLTPAVMELLAERATAVAAVAGCSRRRLAELARRERYLAMELDGTRFNIGVKYGMLMAQLALALAAATARRFSPGSWS